jgi:TnpA family transposase
VIEGALRHCTDADIDTSCIDTHGASVVGFLHRSAWGPAAAAIEEHRLDRLYRPDTGTATASSVPY